MYVTHTVRWFRHGTSRPRSNLDRPCMQHGSRFPCRAPRPPSSMAPQRKAQPQSGDPRDPRLIFSFGLRLV
eukprot:4029748-Prymnesium_polylepis.2